MTTNGPNTFTGKRGQDAFSLVEIVVASGIVGLLLVAVLSGISFGFSLMRTGRDTQRATQILLAKMEQIRLFSWSQLTGGLPATFVESYYPNPSGPSAGFNYTGTVAVAAAPLTQSYAGFMRQVTISLTWASGDTVYTQSVSTLVASNGILYANH